MITHGKVEHPVLNFDLTINLEITNLIANDENLSDNIITIDLLTREILEPFMKYQQMVDALYLEQGMSDE